MRYVKEYEPSPENKKQIELSHNVYVCSGLYKVFNTIKSLSMDKPYKTYGEYVDELCKCKEDILTIKYASSTKNKEVLDKMLEILFKNKDDYKEFIDFYNHLREDGPNDDNHYNYYLLACVNLSIYLSNVLNLEENVSRMKIYNFIEDNDNIMVYDKLTRTENINIFNALKGYRICYDNHKNMYKSSKDLLQAVSVLYDFRFHIVSELSDKNYVDDSKIEDIEFRKFVIDCLNYRPYGKHYVGSISIKAAVIFNLISKFKVYTDVESVCEALKTLN